MTDQNYITKFMQHLPDCAGANPNDAGHGMCTCGLAMAKNVTEGIVKNYTNAMQFVEGFTNDLDRLIDGVRKLSYTKGYNDAFYNNKRQSPSFHVDPPPQKEEGEKQ